MAGTRYWLAARAKPNSELRDRLVAGLSERFEPRLDGNHIIITSAEVNRLLPSVDRALSANRQIRERLVVILDEIDPSWKDEYELIPVC